MLGVTTSSASQPLRSGVLLFVLATGDVVFPGSEPKAADDRLVRRFPEAHK